MATQVLLEHESQCETHATIGDTPKNQPFDFSSVGQVKKYAIAVLIIGGAAAILVWRWWSHPRESTLEAGWPAVAAVLSGEGAAGVSDGHAFRARFSHPFGVAVASDGSIYVADAGDAQRIRRIV